MSEQKEGTTQQNDRLLSEEERMTCQNLAMSGDGLMNQRAKALLALDRGLTRAEACEQSGLTLGQVRYLLATFRQKRLNMFTREVWMEMEQQPQTDEMVLKAEVEEEVETRVDKVQETQEIKRGKKKKQKKEKKVKGKKGGKKDKKLKKKDAAKTKGKKGKSKKSKAKGIKKGKGKVSKKKSKK
jgi:hypothetical protein